MKLVYRCLFVMLAAVQISAAPRDKKGGAVSTQTRLGSPRYTRLNIFGISHWFGANLLSANNPFTGDAGLEFPPYISPRLTMIFADGLVWGGHARDGRAPAWRVGGAQKIIGTIEGAILPGGVPEDPAAPSVRIYRIRRDYATANLVLDATDLGLDENTVRARYHTDWLEWPAGKGAPFYDVDGDGFYTPGFRLNEDGIEVPKLSPLPGEMFDPAIHADEPGLADADQVVWTVANDLDEATTASFAGGPPFGLEVQLTAWAYHRDFALGHTIFKRYRIIYKGSATTPANAAIDPMYVAQWSDPDVGTYSDDFVGVDSTASLMFAYNASDADAAYSSFSMPPPAVGYDLLQGPIIPGGAADVAIFDQQERPGFRNRKIDVFAYFLSQIEPKEPGPLGAYETAREWANLFHGCLPQSDFNNCLPYTNTVTGQPTRFPLAGDPVAGLGDIDRLSLSPGDRLMMGASGPFSLALNDTQEVLIATMVGVGSDRLGSVDALKSTDLEIQNFYDRGALRFRRFLPTAPNTRATGLDGEIVLNWGFDPVLTAHIERQNVEGHSFEGYNVYQMKTTAPYLYDNSKRIATFDRVDGIKIIYAPVFDAEAGALINKPVQFGSDAGIRHTLSLTRDQYRRRPIANHQDYYFAVTAYYVFQGLDDTLKTIESEPVVLTVRPRQPEPGTRLNASTGQQLAVTHTGPSDGVVIATVVDPTEITGDDYEVVFEERIEAGGGRRLLWHLLNTTRGDTVLASQSKQAADSSDFAFPTTDGLLVQVLAGPAGAPNGPGDSFLFSTRDFSATVDPRRRRQEALSLINVFPNPYVGLSRLDRGSLFRHVRFTHLPPNTTIRIYNLAGALARTLRPERQQGQYMDWDLLEESNKRVANGIYLAHVQMPGIGSKVLKLVIVQ